MIRIVIESESGQYILFDKDEKLRVYITVEAIKAFGNEYTLDEICIKKFYNEYRHKNMAINKKSANKNSHGYYESSLTINNFLDRGVFEKDKANNMIAWNAVHYYENEMKLKDDKFSLNNTFKQLFDKSIILNEQFTNNNQNYVNLGSKDKSHAIAHYLGNNSLLEWIDTLCKK